MWTYLQLYTKMDLNRAVLILLSIILCCSVFIPSAAKRAGHHLHVGFYSKSCPQAQRIVAEVVSKAVFVNSTLPAGLIRLYFHDCFVNGCDGSILLDSTPSGEPVEKQSGFNGKSLRGLELIDDAKQRLEQECPGIVSCADILTFASRDAVVLSGLPYYRVPGGRRDSRSSLASTVAANLPTPSSSVDTMIELFTKKGLSVDEMVALIGAHSIGVAHCSILTSRLYNFNSTNEQDPTLRKNKLHTWYLKWMCPRQGSWFAAEDRTVAFDESSTVMDTSFYVNLMRDKALLRADQLLAYDERTSGSVGNFAYNHGEWSSKFRKAMVTLGRLHVLTGTSGEIRTNCRSVNN